MMRRLFIVAAFCSALLFVTTVAGWIVSEFCRVRVFGPVTHAYHADAGIDRGSLAIIAGEPFQVDWHASRWQWVWQKPDGTRTVDALRTGNVWGFSIDWDPPLLIVICVPLRFVAFGGLLSTAAFAHLAGRHRPPGHCAKCGYDLRASKGRCPECGTTIPRNAEATA